MPSRPSWRFHSLTSPFKVQISSVSRISFSVTISKGGFSDTRRPTLTTRRRYWSM